MTRRDWMKAGMSGTAGLMLGAEGRPSAKGGADDASVQKTTPFKTTPFLDRLPIMPVKQYKAEGPGCESSLETGFSRSGEHQYWDQFAPYCAYEMRVKESKQRFHRDLPDTTIWGYDGIFPGPTFHARYGQPGFVRFYNELPARHRGFGIPSITTHLHNAHTAPESDGNPSNFFDAGTTWDNHYPNVLPGFSTGVNGGKGDPTETLGTLWYHDHRQDFTAQNTYAGLEGFYLLFDELDCNDETHPNGLGLPSGEFDVPLLFADRVFGADGNLVYDFFALDGILGDKYTVNGKVQPFMEVKRRKYRFRLLDGGPSRFYTFALSDGTPLIQIANDGNLLPQPVARPYVTCGVAERHDVIVDFSKYPNGTKLYLTNRANQISGRGPEKNLLTPGIQLLEFRVKGSAPEVDHSRIPAFMRALPSIDLSSVVNTRTWVFGRANGGWAVNGKPYNPNVPLAQVKRNTREVWILRNDSSAWSHPVHIHFEEHQILSRNGKPCPPFEGRKDVAVLGPTEEVQIYFNFRDYLGPYPMHCHNTVHEDHAMMIRWDMVE